MFGYGSPVLRAIAIDVHFRVKPSRIVESTGFDKRQFGQYGEIGGNWRSTLRTEIAVNPLTTVAGVMKGLKSPLD